jgi:AraC-like DNA-binding protein
VRALNAIKLSLLQNRFAKVQGDTVTKDYLDLRLNEAVALLRQEMTKSYADLMKEISALKMDSQFTKWTNKAILLSLGVITSALIKIAFFH